MASISFQNTSIPILNKAADDIAKLLVSQYPPVELPESPDQGSVPFNGAEDIAWALTQVVAEVLQAYLNAGSESDAIHENLGPHIEAEVMDWVLPGEYSHSGGNDAD